MSLPYFPLYVTDFEGDTSHLTLAEDGAYNRLLRLCWRTHGCSIPADAQWIQRRMRVTKKDFAKVVEPVMSEFFIVKNQRVFNNRLSEEYAKTQAKANAARENGKKGGRPAKSLATNNKDKPKPYENKTQEKATHTHTHIDKRDTKVSPKKPPIKQRVFDILSNVAGSEAVNGFIEMRWGIKSPMTERAAELIASKLQGRMNADAILDLSTENNWKTVYPDSKQLNGGSNGQQFTSGNIPAGASGAHAQLFAGLAANAAEYAEADRAASSEPNETGLEGLGARRGS